MAEQFNWGASGDRIGLGDAKVVVVPVPVITPNGLVQGDSPGTLRAVPTPELEIANDPDKGKGDQLDPHAYANGARIPIPGVVPEGISADAMKAAAQALAEKQGIDLSPVSVPKGLFEGTTYRGEVQSLVGATGNTVAALALHGAQQ